MAWHGMAWHALCGAAAQQHSITCPGKPPEFDVQDVDCAPGQRGGALHQHQRRHVPVLAAPHVGPTLLQRPRALGERRHGCAQQGGSAPASCAAAACNQAAAAAAGSPVGLRCRLVLLQRRHLSGRAGPGRLPRPWLALRAVVVPVLHMRQRAGVVAAVIGCIHAAAAVGPGTARRCCHLVPQRSRQLHLPHAGKLYKLLGGGIGGAKLAGQLPCQPGCDEIRGCVLRHSTQGRWVAGTAW